MRKNIDMDKMAPESMLLVEMQNKNSTKEKRREKKKS